MSLEFSRRYLKDHGIRSGLTSALIADRALARGIEIRPDSRGRLSMKVNGRVCWFDGAKSNLNPPLARRCAQHKDITSRLLRSYGVSSPENMVFSPQQLSAAWSWAESIGSVVVKPPNGGLGRSVHMNLQGFEEFQAAFEAVSEESGAVLVERFLHGAEHRVLMIYGEVAAAARRIPANVVGNGEDSIAALVEEKNLKRRESQNPAHWEMDIDDHVVDELARQDLMLESVPAEGRRVWLRSNSNVHSGGDGVDATDEMTPKEMAMARRAVKAIPGLKLAGLDMLLPRDGQDGEPQVLEVNAYPMITGHHYPWIGEQRDVVGMLVEAMFPEASHLGSAQAGAAALGRVPRRTQRRSLVRRVVHRLRASRRS